MKSSTQWLYSPIAAALMAVVVHASPVQAAELPALDPQIDEYKPVLVNGEDIPAALGRQIPELSLQAVIDGQMEPVPYQIDEYNIGGAVYFKEMDVALDGKEGVLDDNDKLVFLFKDAGPRRERHHVPDGKVLAEVELTGSDGQPRYVYLVEGSRLRSEEQYVRYSTDIGQVETDFYTLVYNKENQLNWDDFSYETYRGERPLDTMKLRVTGGLVAPQPRISLNNEHFVAKPVSERVGPVRTTSQMVVTMWLLGLPILEISYQVHHYPKTMLYDVRTVMGEVRRKALFGPTLDLSLDANQLSGSLVRTELGPKEAAVVDGVMSPLERELHNSKMLPEQNWIWVSTRRNLDVMAFFNFLGEVNEPMNMVYADDKALKDPPERFPGAMPAAGYHIGNFPMEGFFGFVVSVYLSEGFEGKPEDFSRSLRAMPDVRVLPGKV